MELTAYAGCREEKISSGVSNTCLFAPAPYYKLNKGCFLGFLFKPRGGLPPRGLHKKASEKKVSFIYYIMSDLKQLFCYHVIVLYVYFISFIIVFRILHYISAKNSCSFLV